jgi:hypothetical protein
MGRMNTGPVIIIWISCLACIALIAAPLAFLEFSTIGFPDGFRTEWDPARKILLLSFMALSGLVCGWSIFLGYRAKRKSVWRPLLATTILYAIALLFTWAMNHHLNYLGGLGG